MCIHPLQAYSPIPFRVLRTPSAIELGGRLSTHTHTLESAFSRGGSLRHISPRSEVPAEAGRLSKPPPEEHGGLTGRLIQRLFLQI